ncbi:MAG TPA: 2-phospho-L-lactate guanylyltransferase [Nocardioidaceae bacterium]|nr:2-phospho-L-lactate guanylyltransferase [Nocardioidaceae bacterium]
MSVQEPSPEGNGYAVLVPVKRPSIAKSRLAGVGDDPRRELAAAFAEDTVTAVLSCARVDRVLVVTDDHVLAARLARVGAEVIPDGAGDLNGTLRQAAAEMHRRAPGLRLAAVCADLPALRPGDLAAALDAADPSRMSFVPDRQRAGTTAVIAPRLDAFRPFFGRGSRRRHLQAGALEVDAVDVPTLRLDVDDPGDLADALGLGVGPRTAMVCSSRGLGDRPGRSYARSVQATVSAFDVSTGSGRLLCDDGTELAFPAAALAAGALRLVRPGQRVEVETDDGVPPTIVRVSIAGIA